MLSNIDLSVKRLNLLKLWQKILQPCFAPFQITSRILIKPEQTELYRILNLLLKKRTPMSLIALKPIPNNVVI